MSKRILITSGLPYANGSIHLGHLVEYLLSDIYVRALKASGRDAIYVCGDDMHGTPIELNARKRGVAPEVMVEEFQKEHIRDFTRFGIHFDGFYGTHSDVNKAYVYEIYGKLKERGLLEERALEQLFCPKDQRFLPDRFVRGTCPFCSTADQYGDVCESCGNTYSPTDLKNPHCALCGTTPELRSSQHLFFKLAKCQAQVVEWLDRQDSVQSEVRNSVQTWINEGLKDWCITRDGPYFGFPVPDMPGKFFYVWLDAPIGYIGAAHRAAEALGKKPDDWWRSADTEIVHIIGKDIVYFHALFWPAVLANTGFTMPKKLQVHGMLRVNGEKMSKTRGTFINAKVFAEHIDPQYLRYYYASKLSAKVEDIDLSFDEFINRVNAELVNKIVNLYARVVPFVHANFDGKLAALKEPASELNERVRKLLQQVQQAYLNIDSADAIHHAIAIAQEGNELYQNMAPWKLVKTDRDAAHQVCSVAVNICKALTIAIKPALPDLAANAEKMLGIAPVDFQTPIFDLPAGHPLGATVRLIERLEREPLDKIVEASIVEIPPTPSAAPATEATTHAPPGPVPAHAGEPAAIAPVKAEITYDQFDTIDLRAAKILTAERVPKSDKLLKLTVDVGEAQPRQVIAGIGLAYQPEQIVGKVVACLVNLKPAKIMGQFSHAMLLACGAGGKDLVLTELPASAVPGAAVK